jgi:hypothetical protein
MRRAVPVTLILLASIVAPALAQVAPSADERPAVVGAADPGNPPSAFQLPAQQPPGEASGTRRRPSMVGYIADGFIGSQVRIRFDSGFTITDPDRAEFFYAKCGCYARLPATNPDFDADAPGPGPGIANDLDFQQLYLFGEYAFNPRVSLFAELPFRWLQPQGFITGRPCCPAGSFSESPGVSDLGMGAKFAVVGMPTRHLTAHLQMRAPTGDASAGRGTDHWSIEPTLLYGEWLTDRVAIETQVGALFPTGGSAGLPTSGPDKFSGAVFFYGIGPSFELYSSNELRVAPVVELVGWRVLGGFQTSDFSDASGTNIVNLKIGGRLTLRDQSSLYVGFGHALTDAVWYEDILRLEYRYSF